MEDVDSDCGEEVSGMEDPYYGLDTDEGVR